MTTIDITPAADAYVQISNPNTNYGTATSLSIYEGSTNRSRVYLRFNLGSIPADSTIVSASMYIYQYSIGSPGVTCYIKDVPVTNRTWTETGITWNNQPIFETAYPGISFSGTSLGAKAINITSYVSDQYGAGVGADFVITSLEATGTGTATFYSKESATSATNKPFIRVTYYTATSNRIYITSENTTVYPTWNAQNFSGFYYDLNRNVKPEVIYVDRTMGDIETARSILANQLWYDTGKVSTTFKAYEGNSLLVNGANTYYVVGWGGDKYVAINGKANKIAKLIVEQGTATADRKTLIPGETWDMGYGYTLEITNVDTISTPKNVSFILRKDGVILETVTVNTGVVHNYTQTILGEPNVLVFSIYVYTIFAGATTGMVQFKYAWLIDTNSVAQISVGNVIGLLTVRTSTTENITLSNTNTVSLTRNSTINIIGNISLNIADTIDLRLYLYKLIVTQGIVEIRGYVYDRSDNPVAVPSWNAQKFAEFFYDVNINAKPETLSSTVSMSTIETNRQFGINQLSYTTIRVPVNFKVYDAKGLTIDGVSNYYIIGWGGEKYVAINGKPEKLARLLVEQGPVVTDKKTLTLGETWEMGSGYVLTILDIDVTYSQMMYRLSKDGIVIDEMIVSIGDVITYYQTVAGESNALVFSTYVDSIFQGATTKMVQLKYTWLIDAGSYTIISLGSIYGYMIVNSITSDTISLLNNYVIDLIKNTDSYNIIGNLKFKIANVDELRFYLKSDILYQMNITATDIVTNVLSCIEPCNLTVDVTWTNTGNVIGSYIPSIIVDGVKISLPLEDLDVNDSITHSFNLTGLIAKLYSICPDPN